MLIKVSAIITALSVIISAVVTLYKIIRKIDKKIMVFEQSVNENTLIILKMIINNDKMPYEERIKACEKYRRLGGNGVIETKCNVIKKKYAEKLKEVKE